MYENFVTVLQQVLILTAIIGTGFIGKRRKWIEDQAFNTLTNLTLYAAIPCLLIRAFAMEFQSELLVSFGLELLIAGLYHVFIAVIGFMFFRRTTDKKKRVYICCLSLGNIGFMGYALITPLYGNIGLFYGSAYNLIFNVFLWSVGVKYLDNDAQKVRVIDVIMNPNILSSIIGFTIFVLQIHIPNVVDRGMGYLAALAMPLPLLVIGARLNDLKPKQLIGDKMLWLCALLRLIVGPVLFGLILHFVGIRGLLLQVTVILSAMPTASILGMVAGKSDPETGAYTAGAISAITALSIITIPIVAIIATILA